MYKADIFENLYGSSELKQRLLTQSVSFSKDVKPILDSRCVVCHGCYDAPCQLKLGSIEGIDRGATKKLVYEFGRFKAADPTRLFIDAENTADACWFIGHEPLRKSLRALRPYCTKLANLDFVGNCAYWS